MALELDIQNASTAPDIPGRDRFRCWVEAALAGRSMGPEPNLSIRLVDEAEGADLNRRFRGGREATNVLSFPCEPLPGVTDCGLLGDLVICAPIVAREAREQGKAPEAHWAHMVVHGVLHLLGYDHLNAAEAVAMEELERDILSRLGFPAPYED